MKDLLILLDELMSEFLDQCSGNRVVREHNVLVLLKETQSGYSFLQKQLLSS